jgi:hypothetical protein
MIFEQPFKYLQKSRIVKSAANAAVESVTEEVLNAGMEKLGRCLQATRKFYDYQFYNILKLYENSLSFMQSL